MLPVTQLALVSVIAAFELLDHRLVLTSASAVLRILHAAMNYYFSRLPRSRLSCRPPRPYGILFPEGIWRPQILGFRRCFETIRAILIRCGMGRIGGRSALSRSSL